MEATQNTASGLVLGIESSCDETAAAVVAQGRTVLSSVVASQFATHAAWGGVVPELAAREHLRNIVPVVREALVRAGTDFKSLDGIAVTEGPGLAGALLVGVTYARALAWGLRKPLVGVNHLEGHIHAVLLEHAPLADLRKMLALVVSGGHTHLYLAEGAANSWSYRSVGRTVDDAAGEAFDKVAKLLGLGYPGGPWIDALARHGDPHAVPFRFAEVRRREGRQRPSTGSASPDEVLFSFSGIKTAVLRYVESHGMAQASAARAKALARTPDMSPTDALTLCDQRTLDLIASFQAAVVANLAERTLDAAAQHRAGTVLVSGGVAANSSLRERFETEAEKRGLQVLFPSRALSTDNAAMIAAAAWPRLRDGNTAAAPSANPRLALG